MISVISVAMFVLGLAHSASSQDSTPTALVSAPDLSVVARVEPRSVPIGTPFRFIVDISAPKSSQVVIPLLADRFGDFDVVDFGEEPAKEKQDRVEVSRWFALRSYEPGEKTLPAYPVKYRPPGGGEEREVTSNEAVIIVSSLLPPEPTPIQLRDIAAPQEPPFEWRPILIAAAGVVGLGAVVVLLLWLANRKRAAVAVAVPKPHEVALEALRRLRVRRLLEAGRFEEFYVELSAIVRAYVEGRFGVHAPEMTTEEFFAAMQRELRLGSEHRALLGEFLTESDLVKFARHQPAVEDGERAYAAANRFIDESTEARAAQGAQTSGAEESGRAPA